MTGQRGRLHRQHREDAGHQVEDQPAEEGEGQGADHTHARNERSPGRGCRGLHRRGDGRRPRPRGPRGRRTGLGVQHIGAGLQRQHARDWPERLKGGAGNEGQGQAVRSAFHGLRLGVVDDGGIVRIEVGPGGVGALQHRARDRQLEHAALPGDGGGEILGLGRGGQHLGDRLAEAGVEAGRAGGHRQVEGELARLGHTDVGADQQVGLGGQVDGLAGPGVGGDLDGNRQIDLVGVDVVHQRSGDEPPRRRPDDLARAPAGGQGPFDLGRLARIARIAPIGMPPRRDRLVQGDVDGRSGDRGPGLGREFEAEMLGPDRPRLGGARHEPQPGDRCGDLCGFSDHGRRYSTEVRAPGWPAYDRSP